MTDEVEDVPRRSVEGSSEVAECPAGHPGELEHARLDQWGHGLCEARLPFSTLIGGRPVGLATTPRIRSGGVTVSGS